MRDCNSYLKRAYESPKIAHNIRTILSYKENVFTFNDIEFWVFF
jgi:hypothetical protein